MLHLYVVRHSEAVDLGEAGVTRDEDRMLSSDGRKRADVVAQALKALDVHPRVAASSPLPRALETAEVLLKVIAPDVAAQTCDFLKPGAKPQAVLDWLKERKTRSAMIVGHMPDLDDIVLFCITGKSGKGLHLKKAAVACVRFEEEVAPGGGELDWLLQPDQMKLIARFVR